ncbi:DUF4190 domain-containing protein [Demequina sp.]|uniref:DUF4190 domain-containing protein n=1 Tax=Demequina sp. TaxID=2050685 RepID=UPI0025C2E43D|nr:DUF4190 domain-containing protein [Demequina sp.]
MTQQDPWATPPNNQSNGSTPPPPPATAVPPPPEYAQVPPAYYSAPSNTKNDWMGITALILSLATFITGITWIGGIILGHMGMAAAKRGEASNRGVAMAGAVIGWVFAGLAVLGILGFVLFVMAVESSSS